ISPSPLWTLANVWERMRSRLGEQQPRQPGRLPGPAPTGGLFQMRPLLGGRVVAGAGAGGLGLQALDSSRLHGPCNRYTPRPLAGLPWPPASLVDGGGHVDVELLLRRLGPQQRPGRPHLVADRLEVVGVLALGVVDRAELPEHPQIVGLAPGGGP